MSPVQNKGAVSFVVRAVILGSVAGLFLLVGPFGGLPGPAESWAGSPASRGTQGGSGAAVVAPGVVVNGVALSRATLSDLATRYGLQIPSGRYWYDSACGAWGLENGPALGVTLAGADLGGPLRADASGGGSGVLTSIFFNGRELHPYDVLALAQIVPVYPGRYWIDAFGNAGFEGGPALVNLWQLAQQAGGGGRGRGYQRATAGGYIGGDGSTSYFFDPESGSSVMVGN